MTLNGLPCDNFRKLSWTFSNNINPEWIMNVTHHNGILHNDLVKDNIILFSLNKPDIVCNWCRNPTLRELWGHHSHSQKWSFEIPANSERDCRDQNTLHWGVLGTVGKVLKCRCPKWPRMSHLDICSTSYGRKKGRESKWQFDSRPLKVGNRPDSRACRWSATHRWKALDERYNFGLDLVPIRVWGKELWTSKVSGVQTKTVSGLHFGNPRKKSHLDASPVESYR